MERILACSGLRFRPGSPEGIRVAGTIEMGDFRAMLGLSHLKRTFQKLGEKLHPQPVMKRARQKLGDMQQPRAERRAVAGLSALYAPGSNLAASGVKDISATGLYLITEKQLPTGELITLTLQEEAQPKNSSELQISIQAQVARQGEDGLGLAFVLPPGFDPHLWEVLVRNISTLTDQDQIAHVFHSLRAILFLYRLCQSGAEEVLQLTSGVLDSDRAEALARIAILAENMLASEPDVDRMRAHPKLVARILSEGSWTADDLIMQLWAGLLVSSCSLEAPDDSNSILVDLLIQVTPIQAKILTHACELVLASAPCGEGSPSGSVILKPEEMIQITGVFDHYRNATDLAYLFNLGLIQNVFDFTSYHDVEQFDITPTGLGLELYKHCHGRRGTLDPSIVEWANDHLSHFFPPPRNFMMDN